jgi:hypothetical protein
MAKKTKPVGPAKKKTAKKKKAGGIRKTNKR